MTAKIKNSKIISKSDKANVVTARPSRAVLKRAIEKSIKKNKEALKILAKR